ncbi:NACHT domain-containing NTPase [Phycisphaerales bacterium AB-hyl4]|uniref:NACHT domain-containing NTPase n=1 Tax=Natronomicrosphaera hydrolytica TaxID=3242702 RepID=A0ABV4U655_9BACT
MSLSSYVTVTIGAAVAKALLAAWVRDHTIVNAAGGGLIDMLKAKTDDLLAQRRGHRQLSDIGERVAEQVYELFEREGASLDEPSKKAVAHGIADTISNTDISSTLLASTDLDPDHLYNILLAQKPGGLHFGSIETHLYERALRELSTLTIDIASQLPAFSERTFAEVLKRQSSLINTADQILDEVRRLRDLARDENADLRAATFDVEYRRSVVRTLDYLELFGADLSTTSRRHRLSVAYITLSVLPDERTENEEIEEPEEDGNAVISSNSTQDQTVPADEVLREHNRLIIKGIAGSGKTTFLQWLAVKVAGQELPEGLAKWRAKTPFFVRLRAFSDHLLPAPEDFPKLIAPSIAGAMPHGWVHQVFQRGDAVLLIDGVDEISQSRRTDVRKWLEDLVGSYPDTKVVVTARPEAIDPQWLKDLDFAEADLQPMGSADIANFIEHWHDAVRQELEGTQGQQQLEFLASNLHNVLKFNRPLRQLASTPLLCAMLCALHRDRNQQLPNDRIELYEACCTMLLERRDIERHIAIPGYPKLTLRQKRALLEDLSYWLLENGWAEISNEEAKARLAQQITHMPSLPSIATGETVLQYLLDRTGLLRQPASGKIDFTHRTFQEFLAAHRAAHEGDWGVLVKHAHLDSWAQVIMMAAGLGNDTFRSSLLGGIVQRGDRELGQRHQLHLLAVACLDTCVSISEEIQKSVQNRLGALVPPANMTEARALASAGDLAVPYLKTCWKENARPAAASVRSLAEIGTESAFAALTQYTNERRATVIRELLRAWDSFDRESYAKEVVSSILSGRHSFVCDDVADFSGFQYFNSLRRLRVLNCWSAPTLSPLRDLPRLESLRLSRNSRIENLEDLRGLSHLTSLALSHFRALKDIEGLTSLPSLQVLGLNGTGPAIDLEPLGLLHNLKELSLLYTFPGEAHYLSSLTQLKRLSLSDGSDIPGSVFRSLASLEGIHVHYSHISVVMEMLRNAQSVQATDLTACKFHDDIRFTDAISRIRALSIRFPENLDTLAGIEKAEGLTQLMLGYASQVADLGPVSSLRKLERIAILGCPLIDDLTPLERLPKLKEIRLGNSAGFKTVPASLRSKIQAGSLW